MTSDADGMAPGQVLSTRLFPKGQGADACRITGLAARCDWVLLSDWQQPQIRLVKQRAGGPRHIFLSLRAPFPALLHFAQAVLPQLAAPFVLVSGSEDITLPRQTDQRWRQYNAAEQAAIQEILDSPLLIRWFAENLDDASHPRMAPLPLGLVFDDGAADQPLDWPAVPPLAGRPVRVLCAHRTREGPQWEVRRQVTALARGPWRNWTTVVEDEVTEAEFTRLLRAHAFVICAQGGGLDPSPKAWAALIQGTVPLIHAPSLAGAYGLLPAIPVPGWLPGSITAAQLQRWHAWACPRMDGAARAALRHRLMLDYWWRRIAAAAEEAG
ncbi:hypothetical protein J4729_19695 [Leisingera sp. HS039]|uniref:hypothetical protein n=1 Tax=Leisingera sp. HS039 TaxID=2818496 RepID=UPI001B39DB5B|nr:hypothetical protein [Leisingera sp. HS039]MBQ4826747.1 hypothetical protein [Leisingera sp. HS039]